MLNERVKKAHVDPSNTVERLIADSDLRLKGVIRDISKAFFYCIGDNHPILFH